jgi:hypothetical protein
MLSQYKISHLFHHTLILLKRDLPLKNSSQISIKLIILQNK